VYWLSRWRRHLVMLAPSIMYCVPGIPRQLIAMGGIVRRAEEGLLAPVAALRDMMGNARNHNARKPRHRLTPELARTRVKCVLCPRS